MKSSWKVVMHWNYLERGVRGILHYFLILCYLFLFEQGYFSECIISYIYIRLTGINSLALLVFLNILLNISSVLTKLAYVIQSIIKQKPLHLYAFAPASCSSQTGLPHSHPLFCEEITCESQALPLR